MLDVKGLLGCDSRGNRYSENFKRMVVAEVESGALSREAARHKYAIGGKMTVLRWCRKYGKLHMYNKQSKTEAVMDKKLGADDDELERLKLENEILRKQLDAAEIKNEVFEKLIEIAERKFGIDIKKKRGGRL